MRQLLTGGKNNRLVFGLLRTWTAVLSISLVGSFSVVLHERVVAQQADQPAAMTRLSGPGSKEDTRYRIGPGDVLTILVRKAPELSGPVRVDQRGMIRLPMIPDEVQAACFTESELANQIRALYLEYKRDPSVEVFVSEFQSRPVSVIGSVNSPGQFRLQRQVRLLELLTFAGGPSLRAGRTVNVVHAGGPNICDPASEKKNSDVAEQITMYRLTDTVAGKQEANPLVQPGDIIQIPEADQIFVIGHVNSPQAIPLRDKPITISRAIAMAGGTARDGKTDKVRIIRQVDESKQEIFVNLKAIEKQKAEDIALLPNDIVEVPASAGKTLLGIFTGSLGPTISGTAVRAIPGVP